MIYGEIEDCGRLDSGLRSWFGNLQIEVRMTKVHEMELGVKIELGVTKAKVHDAIENAAA
jgi:hypothetical protein